MCWILLNVDGRGYWEKLFVYLFTYWWTVLVFLISSSFLSLTCLVLIRQAARPVLWIIIFLCPAILLAMSVSLLGRYSKLKTVNDGDTFQPFITSMSSYWFDKNTWLIICAFTFITTTDPLLVTFLPWDLLNIELWEGRGEAPSLSPPPPLPLGGKGGGWEG